MLIDLQYIEFKNFLPFGNRLQKVEFHEGINILQGYNNDNQKRNGSGKTSFLETILFGLYGKTSKDITKKQLVNWKNKKHCLVNICFLKGDDEYIISRGLKPDFLKIIKNKEEQEQLSQRRDLQNYIEEEILCMDYLTFSSLIHCNSNSSQSIFDVPKQVKRKFLETLFNLHTYSDILKACNKKIKKIEESIYDNTRDIKFINQNISNIDMQNKEFKKSLNNINLDSYKSDNDNILKELSDIENTYKDYIKIKPSDVSKNILTSQMFVDKHNNVINKISAKLQYVRFKFKDIKDKDISNVDIEKKCTDIKNKIQSITDKDFSTLIKELINKKEVISLNLIESQKKYKELFGDVNINKGKLLSLPDIYTLKDVVSCPTCLQKIDINVLSDNVESSKSSINGNILELESYMSKLDVDISQYKKDINDIDENISSFKKQLNSIEDLEKSLNLNTLLRTENDKLITVLIKKKSYINVENKLSLVLATKRNDILVYEEQLKDSMNTSRMITEYDLKKKTLKNKQDFIKEQKKKEEERYKEIKSYLSDNEKKIKEYNDSIKTKEKTKLSYTNILSYLEYIKTLCSDEAIKQYAVSHIVPYINKQANAYLAETGFGFYLKLDSLLDVEVKGPGIDEATFGNLSGGESKCTNLSMQLAFLDVCKVQSPVFPNILLFDEILDSAIDADGIEKIMQIIRKKQKTDKLKVFIISHRSEISSIEFDRIYKAEMERGFSVIKHVL